MATMSPYARVVAWGMIGIATADAPHYMLYRMTLPLKPFIYQAF
jgi:hypothetical protein